MLDPIKSFELFVDEPSLFQFASYDEAKDQYTGPNAEIINGYLLLYRLGEIKILDKF